MVAVLLCVSFLAGCGNAAELSEAKTDPVQTESTEPAAEGELVYQAHYLELSDSGFTSTLENGTPVDDTVYFTTLGVIADNTPEGTVPDWPEQYWEYGPILCKIDLNGSVETIPYVPEPVEDPDIPEQANSGVVFDKLCAATDHSLWILEKHYYSWSDAPENVAENDPEYLNYSQHKDRYFLVHVEENGTAAARFPLDELAVHAAEAASANGDYTFEVRAMVPDSDGNIVLGISEWLIGTSSYVEDNRACVIDAGTGAVLETIPLNSIPEHMVTLKDGTIAVACFEGGTELIGLLDMKQKAIASTLPIGDFIDCLTAGGGAFPLYYNAGDSFYGIDPESGEIQKLFNWISCDVARNGDESISVLQDGRIVTTSGHQTAGKMENELIVLAQEPVNETEKTTLKMAVMNLYPFTSAMVSRFNRSNSQYRIEVTDYSQYNDYTSGNQEDWYAGISRLQTEIIAGDVPDILDISLLSANRFGSKGILEDLYPYIDADPELDRSMLMEHVLKAFEENGKLYQTVSNFYILTTAGLSRYVGDKMGWTMEEFHQAMQQLQEENPNSTVFDRYMTRDNILTFLLYLEMEDFVDWNTGECRFDSESFTELLEFVKSFPTAFDWSVEVASADDFDQDGRILAGQQLLKQCNFVTFEDVQTNTVGLQGAPCTFIGYPTENGVGSMFAQIGNSFAITSNCKDKDAAWQFVREFFLPDYQEQLSGSVFPTNKAVYEEMKQQAMSVEYQRNPDGSFVRNADGERIESSRGTIQAGGAVFECKVVSEEEVALIEEIIEATTSILHTDGSLKDIIVSQAAPFFEDQRSAEEVVKLIQSKASLYVNEQR